MKKTILVLMIVGLFSLLFVGCAGGGGGIDGDLVVVQYLEEMISSNELISGITWTLSGDVKPAVRSFESESGERALERYITFTNQEQNQMCELSMDFTLSEDSVLSFTKKNHTESNSNHFYLYIDEQKAGNWYWTCSEQKVMRRLSEGEHTIKWTFSMNHFPEGTEAFDYYAAFKDLNIQKRDGYDLGEVVGFSDENLKGAVLWALGLTEMIGSASRESMALELERNDNSLFETDLEDNFVKSEPRKYARALANEVYAGEIADIIYLDAGNSNITSIEGINQLDKLNMLILGENNITDISPLQGLNKLRYLVLSNNNITDIQVFNHLINEEEHWWYLDLGNNDIRDITALGNLTTLDELSIRNNKNIADFTPISTLVDLTFLNLNGTGVSDISFLENLTNLSAFLAICYNNITDLSVLENLTNLTHLTILGNNISDFSPLSSLINMEYLGLGGYDMTEGILEACDNMTKLNELYIYYSNLEDLSFLRDHEVFRNVEVMWLYDNNISDISDITLCPNIKNLSFRKNNLVNILPLSALTTLEELYLQENQIADISALVDNENIASGDVVAINENSLDLSEGSEDMQDITALINRGVTVDYLPWE